MATVFRSLHSAIAVSRPLVAARPAFAPLSLARAFTASAIRTAGHGPPQLIGEGVKSGAVPTDEEQATGLERFELLGKLEGVDVFDMKPLEMTRLGTMADPIPIFSLFPERHVGCTGYPADSHDTIWLQLNTKMKNHRCPECGSVYTLQYEGDANAHHH